MEYSDKGYALTQEFEGLRLEAYQDQGGKWTIGYGHTGPDVYRGLSISAEEAIALLKQDVQMAIATVSRLVTIPITQNQFDALVDFTFNLGEGNFASSTLLRRVNVGNDIDAAREFLRWDYVAGEHNAGLARRREAESQMFKGAI